MRPHAIASYTHELTDVTRHARDMARILNAGLFDGEDYRCVNPECAFSDLRCLWHWVRHGYGEGRFSSEKAINHWLIDKLTSGALTAKTARRLWDAGQISNPHLEKACRASKVNIHELRYLERYLECEFDAATTHLNMTGGLFYLCAIWRSLRTMPDFQDLKDRYKKIANDPLCQPDKLRLEDLKRLRDVALASGAAWEEIVALNRRIHANERNSSLPAARVVSSPNDLRLFASTAKKNEVLQDQFEALYIEESELAVKPADEKSVILTLPDDPIWFAHGENEAHIRSAFIRVANYIFSKNVSVIPLPAPQTRNITAIQYPPFTLVSYHTYANNRPDILHYKETSLRGVFFFDRRGYSGASECGEKSYDNTPIASALIEPIKQTYAARDMTKYSAQRSGIDIDSDFEFPARFVFAPLQVLDDTSRRWCSLDPARLLNFLADYYADKNVRVVAKRHPYDRTRHTKELLSDLQSQGKIIESKAPIKSLISRAEIIFTMNSGVGFEALLYNKPVISTGRSEYGSAVFYCKNEAEIKNAIDEIETQSPAIYKEKIDRYLSDFFGAAAFESTNTDQNLLDSDLTLLAEHLTQRGLTT